MDKRHFTNEFNGDGKLALVNADNGSDTLSVHLGNGDGTFQPRTTIVTGPGPLEVVVADINDDGNLDLINTDVTGNTLSVYLGNGMAPDGTFQARTSYSPGNNPYNLVAGDFNGDNVLDIAHAIM